MKVARFYEPGDLRVEEADRPTPVADELLLRVRACATCGTDVKIFHHGHRNLKTLPRVIGHEIAGEVVEVGDDVDGWTSGDRVQCIAYVPCGHCFECTHRKMTVCDNATSVGYDYDGGFAEHMIVPENACSTMNADWHNASINFALQNVATVTTCGEIHEALASLRADFEKVQQDMLYARAEVQNVRRRMEKDVQDARAYAATGFARDTLALKPHALPSRSRGLLRPDLSPPCSPN